MGFELRLFLERDNLGFVDTEGFFTERIMEEVLYLIEDCG